MGYRGKLAERQQARQLRRTGLPLTEIALRVGASGTSVSLWFREVQFDPLPRVVRGRRRAPNAMIAFFCASGGSSRTTRRGCGSAFTSTKGST